MLEEAHQGALPRAICDIFKRLQKQQQEAASGKSRTYEYDVRVQFLEIYGEEIRDLLNPHKLGTKLSIRDVGNEEPEVVGATMHKVDSAEEALLCLTSGMVRRVTASTAMNEGSSRSHAILSMAVTQSTTMNESIENPKEHVQSKTSRFNFVDLAGSERQKRTQATGQRLREGININQGLLVLGNVISALGDVKKRGSFVPYRDSKLTRLLKGSLGGNHKTLMIACVSPSSSNMDETLNCLRYANRAKNIQNHAIVNLDSTSAMVAELKVKIQQLAMDLIKVKSGKADECSFPMSVIEVLAEGGEAGEIAATSTQAHSPSGLSATAAIEAEVEAKKLRAENESYRIQLQSLSEGRDPSDALRDAYTTKVADYEREIAILKNKIQIKDEELSNPQRGRARTRSESPELSRLKSQMFGSMSKSITVEAEVKAEEEAAKNLSDKYLKRDADFTEAVSSGFTRPETPTAFEQSASLDADLFELSNSISAKEELIHQLQATQEKFETMREFYEEKLREMEGVVAIKEAETEKLSEELKKLGTGHTKGQEIAERLKEKKAQVAELRRKQSELSRLTNVASRNESQVARLKLDVQQMKLKKIDLQKQITSERKCHMTEVKKMKKESMQKDKELSKAKREVNKKSQEASKAQKIAKARLEQMNHLKVKYKDSEKRLRLKTVKQGVLKKAGLDPIIFGRRQFEGKNVKRKQKCGQKGPNVDQLRDFFDQRVADVSRRENLAEKLAKEWEEHLELTIQKDESLKSDAEEESLRALESAIKYREERIRQLASKLGKREKRTKENPTAYETLIFNEEFDGIVGTKALENGADIVAKVLFGMVVRERRRIASLARTASSLDEKFQETESALVDKEAAFNAYVGEHRLDSAALAQDQQQHILSLMEMVKEGHTEESKQSIASRTRSKLSSFVEDGNSRLLVLANERIDVLERQLTETQLARDSVHQHQERENAALEKLEEKTKECEDLMEDVDDLRGALHHIRAEVAFDSARSLIDQDKKQDNPTEVIQDIVTGALHSTSGGKSKRSRTSGKSRRGRSPPFKKLTIETQLHSSDSETVPDWAEEIMADLAIIAEGKMPSILLESEEVLEAEKSFEAESQDEGNVFDRLSNPKSYTGVQKKSFSDVQTKRSTKTRRPIPKINTSGSFQSEDKKEKKKDQAKKKKEKAGEKKDVEKRNVFDRLLSPSNITGTQKQRFNQIQNKKGKTIDKAIEKQFVSVRRQSRGKEFDFDEADDDLDFLLQDDESDAIEIVRKETPKTEDYSNLNVFERLNKETTQAYKEKVHTNIAEKLLDDVLDDEFCVQSKENDVTEVKKFALHRPTKSDLSEAKKEVHRQTKSEDYSNLNVFERLSKETTRAYEEKVNTNIAETLLDDLLSEDDLDSPKFDPHSEKVKEYTRGQDVFERLTKTSTRAFPKKTAAEDLRSPRSPVKKY